MSKAANKPESNEFAAPRTNARLPSRPFAGAIDSVIVFEPVAFAFEGAVANGHAEAIWTWICRDLCADLIALDAVERGQFQASDLDAIMPQIQSRLKDSLAVVKADPEKRLRLAATLRSVEALDALPTVILALRNRALLEKARAFGSAINSLTDDAALGVALQSMPLKDPALAALLFHTALGQIANPTRLIKTVIRLAGSSKEDAISRLGFGPIVDAILAHAQNQMHILQPMGAFADIDLICRSLDRFHRLVRAATGYIEFARGSRWSGALAGITKQASDRMEPRLRDVVGDLNMAMRRGREGNDRLDDDSLLAAINGVYLLATIRECRDSLALNATFDKAWGQVGQALEMHLQRNLDLIRQHPDDQLTATRLDAGIKMAEVRFNREYADTLRRARAAATRRG